MESRGLYNVPKQRTSQAFYSQEELDELQDTQPDVSGNVEACYRRHHSVSVPQSRDGERSCNVISAQGSRLDSKSMDNLDCSIECTKDKTNAESTVGMKDRIESNIVKVSDYPIAPPSPYHLSYNQEGVLVYTSSDTLETQGDCAPSNLTAFRSQDNLVPFNNSDRTVYNSAGSSQYTFSNFKPLYPNHSPSREQWTLTRTTIDNACSDSNMAVHNYLAGVGHVPNSYLSGSQTPLQQTLPLEAINHPLCQSNQPNMSESSQKAKEKEWYETCLDSPVTPRKFTVGGYEKLPKCDSLSLQPSPVRIKKSLFPQNYPHGASESSSRLSPSVSCDKESDSTYLQSSFMSSPDCTVVSMGQFQPYREETKPYELSDYYKYSTKIRKQKQQQLEKQSRAHDGSMSSLSTSSGRDCSVSDEINNLMDYKVSKRGPFHSQHLEVNHIPDGISPVENHDNFSYNQLRSGSLSSSPHYLSSVSTTFLSTKKS